MTKILKTPKTEKLLLLGYGNVAQEVFRLASGYSTIYATTREAEKASSLQALGVTPVRLSTEPEERQIKEIEEIASGAHVLVSFPPDDRSDECFARACSGAARIVYISTTGVYGSVSGHIDESSPVDDSNERAKVRLTAERHWLDRNAVVLRAPALYGPDYGLHIRLKEGRFRMPGAGLRFTSRIHLVDLARIILAIFESDLCAEIFVVGDEKPATQREVVEWLCERIGVEIPESAPEKELHVTLRADRKIDSAKIRKTLGIELIFPTYVEGFAQCLLPVDE